MFRRIQLGATAVCTLFVFAAVYLAPAAAQNSETEIRARARVLPDIGPGLIGIKRDVAGHYYVVASPASTVLIFSADGKRIGEIPSASVQDAASSDAKKSSKIVFAADFDVDSSGHVLVADRGANNVKIFAADGSLKVLWDSQQWAVQFLYNKFDPPVVNGGQIYVPNYNGGVDLYRLAQ